MAGFKVICIVADGASVNRKFFTLNSLPQYKKSGVTYVVPNICLPGNFIYFIADVPCLIKTVRNAWHNSQANRSRHLKVK